MSDPSEHERMEEEEEILDEYVMDYEDAKSSKSTEKFMKLLQSDRSDEVALKIKEQCLLSLAKLHAESKQFGDVMGLLKSNSEFLATIPKARTAKIVRSILDSTSDVSDASAEQIQLCRDVIAWCVAEKRTFLRQRVEGKLANLLLNQKTTATTHEALKLINTLLAELKKLDDKQLLTETHLSEARIYHAMQNIPKSKAALTASRSASTSIYVVPLLQAELDEMSGILHCEEGDTVTAFSYFLEAYEAFDHANDKRALTVLKYMALCKILGLSVLDSGDVNAMSSAVNDVAHLFTGKYALRHSGADMNAMKAVGLAAEHRSLQEFKEALEQHGHLLKSNNLIAHNLDQLYSNMFEGNLLKIIQPYSCVELSHIAKLIRLSQSQVEKKLSQMILDGKFNGILEQGKGHLIVYDAADADANYSRALDVVGNMGSVVEVLSDRAKRINTKNTVMSTDKEDKDKNKKSTELDVKK